MSKPEFDVMAVGNAIVDVIAECHDNVIMENNMQKGVMQLVFSEEEASTLYDMMPDEKTEKSGGSAANSIAGIAALGGKTAFIGKVADDELGKTFTREMRELGAHYETPALTDGVPTARCMVLVTPDAERTMNTYLGASVEFGPEDLDETLIKNAQVTYLEGYLFDKELAKKAFFVAAAAAKSAGRKIALTLSDPFCVERHRDDFLKLIEGHVDILFANQEEIKSLYQTDDVEEALNQIRDKVETVAVTRSADGSTIFHQWKRYDVSAVSTEVVDTTGAGDLYAAGFLYGYTQGYDMDKIGMIAAACAAEIISHLGAKPACDLKQFVQSVLENDERLSA